VTTFLALTTLGVVVGCIYALTATGLVVTYTTSGIFNFAHGAIGMFGAFSYWQLAIGWHWPAWIALPAVLLVEAPLLGAGIEAVLIRPLRRSAVDLSLVVTLGLLLFLIGIANLLWNRTKSRILPAFLHDTAPVQLGGLQVSANQILVVVVAVTVAVGLRVLFVRTRIGIAMRGVVDDPDLAAMAGASPVRIQQLSWALGASLAALAGILLAPLVTLDILTLTLLVINGYAAALFGRLTSLPWTAVGALALGLLVSYARGYLPTGGVWEQLEPSLPMLFLFLLLVFVPAARLKAGSRQGAWRPGVPSLRLSVVSAVTLVVVVVLLGQVLSAANVTLAGRAMVVAITLLALVLLTGYSGQVSLCHLTFLGIGAYAMGRWGHGSLLGVVLAVGLTAVVGALLALLTSRLTGLYLALATFAFAKAMDESFFTRELGSGGTLTVPRLHLPGLSLASDRSYLVLCTVVFAAAAVAVLAVRRGRWGRQLSAVSDSEAAAATLGLDPRVTKVVVFSVSAGLAGLSGALYGGLQGTVSPSDFAVLGSLSLLLALRIGGVSTVTGALFGAVTVAFFPLLQAHVPTEVQLAYLLTGLAAVSLGRDPDGFGGQLARAGEQLRAARLREVSVAHP
jgi:branched-chain amino acid transport system permease protein